MNRNQIGGNGTLILGVTLLLGAAVMAIGARSWIAAGGPGLIGTALIIGTLIGKAVNRRADR